MALPRALRLDRLHRVGDPDPARLRQGPRRRRALRRRSGQSHRQGPSRGARELPPGRALPGERRGPLHDGDVGDPAPGAPPDQALRPRGRLRPVRLLPGLHPPRPLQHLGPDADGRPAAECLRRRERRVRRPRQRVRAVPPPVRRADGARPPGPAPRRGRAALARGAARRALPHLERPTRRQRPLQPRRGRRRPRHPGLRPRLLHGLRGDLLDQPGGRGPAPPRPARSGAAHERRALQAVRRRRRHPPLQALPDRLALAERGPADLHPHGRRGRRRAALRGRAIGRAAAPRLRLRPPRTVAGGLVVGVQRRAPRPLRGRRARRLVGGGGVRRTQPARPRRAPHVAAGRHSAHGGPLPAPDPADVQPGLPRGCARRQPRHRPRPRPPLRGALRPGGRRVPRRRPDPGAGRHRRRDRDGPRRRRLARPRPDHPVLPRGHPGDPADQLLPGRRRRGRGRAQALRLDQAQPQGRARAAGAAAGVRDLGLRAAGRGRAPALRPRRARRAPLERPPGGLPDRDPRARQGADGQERRHRPDRLQGRLLRQAAARPGGRPRRLARGGDRGVQALHLRAPRPDRQPRRGRDRPAARRRPARHRRPLPRRRRRQGHGDLLRHRQRRGPRLRLLARRRLRLRWVGRLRPQGDGHHGPRRLGVGQAALPRDGCRHPEYGVHRRRRR